MAYRVEIARQAELEASESFLWRIERLSVEAAVKWYNELMISVGTLAEMPGRCGLAPENDCFEDEIQQLHDGKRSSSYRILFKIRGETVYVLHIVHGTMNTLTA